MINAIQEKLPFSWFMYSQWRSAIWKRTGYADLHTEGVWFTIS